MQIILQAEKYIRKLLEQGKTVKQIVKESGLTNAKLLALRNSEPKKIDRADLEKLCRYLIDSKVADQSELPGSLLEFKPSKFWDLLASRNKMQFFTGVRRDEHRGDLLQIAADAEIQKNLLYRVTSTTVSATVIDQTLVETWKHSEVNEVSIRNDAVEKHKSFFRQPRNNLAAVSFGSVKSNPVIEPFIAAGFSQSNAFVSEDETVTAPQERSVPFFLLYRERDPHPPSSHAGCKLSVNNPGQGPGIYYEDETGDWIHVPWDRQSDTDVALVYYRFEKRSNYLEMVLGGFSGDATSCLAHFLRHGESEKLWPAVYEDANLIVGIYLIKFTFRHGAERNLLTFQPPQHSEVIPLGNAAVAGRVQPHRVSK